MKHGRRAYPAGPVLFSLLVGVHCSQTSTSTPAQDAGPPPAWQVRDGFIRDTDGRAVILRGVNLSGRHKYAPWFDFHQAADFQRVRAEWGMNSVRFLVEWAALEPQPDAFDDAYVEQVRQRLDWAQQAGLLVVLDMHQDVYGEGFGHNGAPRWTCEEQHYQDFQPQPQWFLEYLDPNVVACFDKLWTDAALQDHFVRAWGTVAQAFADHPAVVGFDVLNEPFMGSFSLDAFEPQALQPLYEAVITEVRIHAPDWLAFVEPMNLRNLGQPTRLTPFPFDGVVYAPHSYDASAEQGQGFDPARRDAIAQNVALLAQEARALGAALWVGEYGGVASHAGIGEYMDAQHDAVAAVWGGSAYWHYGQDNGYGMLDPDGNEKPALMDVLVRPWPERVDGTPMRWAYDEGTRTLTVEWTAAGQAPTLLSVPPRVYPQGFTVQCTGCIWSATADGVALTAENQAHATAVVAPTP